MRIHILNFSALLLFLVITEISYTQTPTISWQKTIGGSNTDFSFTGIPLGNGNTIVCGYSKSNISGEKSSPSFGGEDFWILELGLDSSIIWQTAIGGTGLDRVSDIIPSNDGGYLIIGTSDSPISGNKTAVHYGQNDVFLVKLNASGTILWQKSYGGNLNDAGSKIYASPNGGYFLACTSGSGISGNKSVDSKGGSDFWVLEIDESGAIVNELVFGGSGSEFLSEIAFIPNGNILLAGASNSDISGDKQENSYGSFDYWLVELNPLYQLVNSSTIGGTGSDYCFGMQINSINQFILFGYSNSGLSGNKTSTNYGMEDYWVVKVSEDLNPIWDVTFGGNEIDADVNSKGLVYGTSDDIIIGGASLSDISGNKSIASFGEKDIWLVGLDSTGSKSFEFVAGGSLTENYGNIVLGPNGEQIIFGGSFSYSSGNKTESNRGEMDIWMFGLDINISVHQVQLVEMEMYPNPTNSILNLSWPNTLDVTQIQIVDSKGMVIKNLEPISNNTQIDVSDLPAGIYQIGLYGSQFRFAKTVVIMDH